MRILVCEDEQPIRRLIEITLQARGHTVDLTEGVMQGREQFDLSLENGEPYDLIITDVLMPGPSGFSLAGYVRGRGYQGRLAMLTGSPPEYANMATVGAEYWPKVEAMGNLVNRVESAREAVTGEQV